MIGVHSVATSETMFESTREWVKQRKAFGGRVADLQTVQVTHSSPRLDSPPAQHKLAEIKTSIAVARAFVDQCMALHNVRRSGGGALMHPMRLDVYLVSSKLDYRE